MGVVMISFLPLWICCPVVIACSTERGKARLVSGSDQPYFPGLQQMACRLGRAAQMKNRIGETGHEAKGRIRSDVAEALSRDVTLALVRCRWWSLRLQRLVEQSTARSLRSLHTCYTVAHYMSTQHLQSQADTFELRPS